MRIASAVTASRVTFPRVTFATEPSSARTTYRTSDGGTA